MACMYGGGMLAVGIAAHIERGGDAS